MYCRYTECSEVWTQTTDYFQVVGIILGQLTVGFLGDWLGRRWGMIQVWVMWYDQGFCMMRVSAW